MKLLLDTHSFLWFVLDDPKLSQASGRAIQDTTNTVLVSPASLWEIAIKISLGKYQLSCSFEEFCEKGLEGSGIALLPIEQRHLSKLLSLPFLHKDPFDRLLVAQALADDLTLVSKDNELDVYEMRRMW